LSSGGFSSFKTFTTGRSEIATTKTPRRKKGQLAELMISFNGCCLFKKVFLKETSRLFSISS